MTDAEATLETMRRITDFPFYTATYRGDYRLQEFLSRAIRSPESVVSFFEALFESLGSPAKIVAYPSAPAGAPGCSAFYIREEGRGAIVGKNLDWRRTPVLLLRTAPEDAHSSVSLVDLSACDIFRMNSFKYNVLLSPYVPFDGMNEKGLVVSMLSVQDESRYPVDAALPTLGDFNIIRVMLDTCETVDEALSVFERYTIVQTGPLPIHYLIADKNSACIVELASGRIFSRRDPNRMVLTNYLVNDDEDYRKNLSRCPRFRALYEGVSEGPVDEARAEALLRTVSVFRPDFAPPSTIWSVLFRPDSGEMSVRIGNDSRYYRVKV